MLWKRFALVGMAAAGFLSMPALASTILGTNGSETIRGTAKSDRIWPPPP